MAVSRQPWTDESTVSQTLRREAREQVCPRERVSEWVTRCHAWGDRERSLNQRIRVSSVIALALCRRLTRAAVLRPWARGWRWLWADPSLRLPTAAALVSRRRHLGCPVMRHLFQRVCRPMATEHTQGAFRVGLRSVRHRWNGGCGGRSPCHCPVWWPHEEWHAPASLPTGTWCVSGRRGHACHG
jgi:hypothetical protein